MSRFKDYGGRGIMVCDEWANNFKSFYDWSEKNGYRNDLVIDRIDNDGDYTPSNCRWTTNQENCDNGMRSKKIIVGEDVTTIRKLSMKHGLKYKTIRSRIDRGLTGEDLIRPVGYFKRPPRRRDSLGRFTNKHIKEVGI